jgi:hypothetical protein
MGRGEENVCNDNAYKIKNYSLDPLISHIPSKDSQITLYIRIGRYIVNRFNDIFCSISFESYIPR